MHKQSTQRSYCAERLGHFYEWTAPFTMRQTAAASHYVKHTPTILAPTWRTSTANCRPSVTAASSRHYAVKAIRYRWRKASTKPQKCPSFHATSAWVPHAGCGYDGQRRAGGAAAGLFRRQRAAPPLQLQRSEPEVCGTQYFNRRLVRVHRISPLKFQDIVFHRRMRVCYLQRNEDEIKGVTKR